MYATEKDTLDTSRTDAGGGNRLGACIVCHGGLCLRGAVVVCEKCAVPQPDHPLTLEMAARQKAAKQAQQAKPAETQAWDYPAGDSQRILFLEKHVAAQDRRLATLESQLAVLTQAAAKRK